MGLSVVILSALSRELHGPSHEGFPPPAGGGAGDKTFLARPALLPTAEAGVSRALRVSACGRPRGGTNLCLCPPFPLWWSRCPEGLAESVPCGCEEGSRQTPAPSDSLTAVARAHEKLPAVPVEGEDVEERRRAALDTTPCVTPCVTPHRLGPFEPLVKRDAAVFRSGLRLRAWGIPRPLGRCQLRGSYGLKFVLPHYLCFGFSQLHINEVSASMG